MPLAPVDSKVTLFYQDSGVPAPTGSPYTTIVAVHGYGFNSYIFSRLLPLAPKCNVRLVLLTRRGYVGSTSYEDEEVIAADPTPKDGQSGPDDAQVERYTSFLAQRGSEVARFMAWYIDAEDIPAPSDGPNGKTGGICLLGWSLGNATTLSFIAFANTFEPAIVAKLDRYMRKLVIFEPPHHVMGNITPEKGYDPYYDTAIPFEQRQLKFSTWVSSYYVHEPAVVDFESDPLSGLKISEVNPDKMATLARFSAADFQKCLEILPLIHGDEIALLAYARRGNEAVRKRAIFGNQKDASGAIPLSRVEVSYVWGTETNWEATLAKRALEHEIATSTSPPTRPVKFFALPGGNHLAHWDEPEITMETFVTAIE